MAFSNVLFDHQIFDIQRYGGISRYYSELIRQFRLTNEVRPIIGMGFSSNNYVTNPEFKAIFTHPNKLGLNMQRLINATDITKKMGSTLFDRISGIMSTNRYLSVKALRNDDFDVFHPTYYDPYFLPYLHDRPFVLTIYDMIHERFAHGKKDDPTAARKKMLAERADIIIAISKSTKRDVVELLGVPPQKVRVTYLASSLRVPSLLRPLDGVPERYLLFVGHRGGYKNFTFMLRSLDQTFKDNPDIHLVCVGGHPFDEQERQMMGGSNGRGRIEHLYVSDLQLAQLYANALVYINPSQYEGFGIPVLEAMSCKCPALISNTSSLPEVGGSAAHYFDPSDQRSFHNAIAPLISDEEVRQKAREEGMEQVAKFTWKRTAEETMAVYRSLT